jgi:DNA-binding phage protein
MSRVGSVSELLRHYREMVKATERDLARAVHEDLADGVPVARIARDAGLSRERIYQIRDGRR